MEEAIGPGFCGTSKNSLKRKFNVVLFTFYDVG
jgi:hypothetical protein